MVHWCEHKHTVSQWLLDNGIVKRGTLAHYSDSEFNYKLKSSNSPKGGSNRLVKQLPNPNRSSLIKRVGQ